MAQFAMAFRFDLPYRAAMDAPWKADIDRLTGLLAAHFEAAEARNAERHEQLLRRFGTVDTESPEKADVDPSLQLIKLRLDAIAARSERGFLRSDVKRLTGQVDALREQVAELRAHVVRLESSQLRTNARVDGLAEEVRSRKGVLQEGV